jgi:hypothetical protein
VKEEARELDVRIAGTIDNRNAVLTQDLPRCFGGLLGDEDPVGLSLSGLLDNVPRSRCIDA